MKTFKTSEIQQGYFFTEPAFLDENFVLLSPETPWTPELRTILAQWEFTTVLSDGEPKPYYSGKGFKEKLEKVQNDSAKIASAEAYIAGVEQFTKKLFLQVSEGHSINFDVIASKVRELCDKLRDERRFLLQVYGEKTTPDGSNPEEFNAEHSVRSAIVALLIGINLKLPIHRLIELGSAAFVHEIGMARLPSKLFLSSKKLEAKEVELLRTHTTHGYELLKMNGFPMTVAVTALEHHERENGVGYPRKLSGEKISFYSKIIAVACSYAAITANRPHQDARGGYEGVTGLLRNEGKQYDEQVIRALVFSLSLYPIGQYVMLSDGKKGQVVEINPNNPRYPLVQIFCEQTPDGKNRIIKTSPDGISIARPISKDEM
ncbi:MAG: HD-GYP domain-containing protein [Spirochaetaceae bacterium]|jgi:HD-GYP domain-containing protein (c-di-GMP phosphodiesterase class II)|nr:HD-GYP domain-containing protein [Spirochaetaceae bacterium]